MFNVFAGLGPGGLREIRDVRIRVDHYCVPGASHGGKGDQDDGIVFGAGSLYDEENITSLLGGSGGGTMSLLSMIFPVLKCAQTLKCQFRLRPTLRFFGCLFVCLSILSFIKINDECKLKALRF